MKEKPKYVPFLSEGITKGSGENKTVHLEAEDWTELSKYWKIKVE